MKKIKFLGLCVLVLALVVGVGYSANAALTLDALTVTSSGALTLDGAAASAITVGSATTTGNIAIGGALTTGTLTLGKTTQTGITVISGSTTGANTLFNNVTTGSIAAGAALTSGTIALGNATQTGATTIYGGSTTNAIRLLPVVGAVATEAHAVDIVSGGALSSGDNLVGVNVVLTPTGTAGTWASAVYGKTVQGATKTVNGYISGGEFEVADTNAAPSEVHTLVLDGNSTAFDANSSFIWAQDFGTGKMPTLLKLTGMTMNDANLFADDAADDLAPTHTLKITIDGTPYWILLNNVGPN